MILLVQDSLLPLFQLSLLKTPKSALTATGLLTTLLVVEQVTHKHAHMIYTFNIWNDRYHFGSFWHVWTIIFHAVIWYLISTRIHSGWTLVLSSFIISTWKSVIWSYQWIWVNISWHLHPFSPFTDLYCPSRSNFDRRSLYCEPTHLMGDLQILSSSKPYMLLPSHILSPPPLHFLTCYIVII